MDVWILWGPEPVTAHGEDRQQAVTIGKHGVQIARGAARGLLLPGVAVDHHLDALAFLQQVCIKAGLPTDAWKDDDTKLQVFEGDAIHGRLAAGRVRRPAARRGWRLLSGRSPRSAADGRRSCLPPRERGRSAAVAGRSGAARRLDLLGPAGGGRVSPGDNPRSGDHPLPATPAARRTVGRGAAPAMALSRRRTGGAIPNWPHGWPMP